MEFSYNFSMFLGGIAEVGPTGEVSEFANLSSPSSIHSYSNASTQLEQFAFNGTDGVTAATGEWSPGSNQSGGVVQSGPLLGETAVQVLFLFPPSGLQGGSMRFDVDVSDWPWAHSQDRLELDVAAPSPAGTHFVWSSSANNLTEVSNSTGAPQVALQFGTTTTMNGAPTGPANGSATAAASILPGGADVLLSFTGGGYSQLHYDPYLVFNLGARGTLPSPGGPIITLLTVAAILIGVVVSVVLAGVMVRARRDDLKVELRSHVQTH